MTIVKILIWTATANLIGLLVYIIRIRHRSQIHNIFMGVAIGGLIWAISAIGEAYAGSLIHFNPIVETMAYGGIAITSTFILLLGIVVAHNHIEFSWKYKSLFILPICSVLVVSTNEYHHWFMKVFNIIIKDLVMGPAMMIHYIYCYIYIGIGVSLLIRTSIRNSGILSKQVICIVLGLSSSIVINVLVSFGIIRGGCYSTIPVSVLFYMLLGLAILKYDLLNIVPIAMEIVVNHMTNAFVVINRSNIITTYNNKACELIGNIDKLKGMKIQNYIDKIGADKVKSAEIADKIQAKVWSNAVINNIEIANRDKTYTIEISPIARGLVVISYILVFKDTTIYTNNLKTITDYQAFLRQNIIQLSEDRQDLLVRTAITEQMANIDALTQTYNHRIFQEYFSMLYEQAKENRNRLQLAIVDIDNFKYVNDTYGHSVGDIVLRRIASRIKELTTVEDVVSRYGGEEFAIIFNAKNIEDSYKITEIIRRAIQEEKYREIPHSVTVSIGICDYTTSSTKDEIFKKADEALYKAKNNGKNKIVVAD